MNALLAHLETARVRIDAMSLRERALLFLALMVILFMVWDSLLMAPLEARKEAQLTRLETVRDQINSANAQIQTVLDRRNSDPNAPLRSELARIDAQIGALDERIGRELTGLITPQQMARALEQMLIRQTRLKPVRVENLGSVPLVPAQGGGDDAQGVGVFRHRLLLEMEGSYTEAVDYLQKLQALPWSFYWDEVSIEMVQYPVARIRVVVSTLSLREGWLGV